MTKPTTRRLLLIGLDGGTFHLLRPAMADGTMPRLAALADRGVSTTLMSTQPPITPVAWSTFMTGTNPDKHGIFDFRNFDGQANVDHFVNATHLRQPTIWQILSHAGHRVGVLNLPLTFPPTPVNGFIVAGFDTPTLASPFCYPPELREALLKEVPEYDFIPSWGQDAYISEAALLSFLDAIKLAFTRRTEAAVFLLQREDPDVFMIQFQNLDVLQHKAWGYLDPDSNNEVAPHLREAAQACLAHLDHCLGRLLDAPQMREANVIALSDHGFGPVHGYLYPNQLLRDWGYLVQRPDAVKTSPPSKPNSKASGWQKGFRKMKRLVLRVLGRSMVRPTWLEQTMNGDMASLVGYDSLQTKALVGMAELSGFVQVLESDPDRRGQLSSELCERFKEAINELTGQPLFAEVLPAAEVFETAVPFDLVLVPPAGWATLRALHPGGQVAERVPLPYQGTHRSEGVILAAGPDLAKGIVPSPMQLRDLAPTILHLLGEPLPRHMDGHVAQDLLATSKPITFSDTDIDVGEVKLKLAADDEEVLRRRLESLGYLG